MGLDIVEKLARKEIRSLKLKEHALELADNGTQAFIVAQHLLAKILPNNSLKIVQTGLQAISRDELNAQFLADFFENRTFGSGQVFLSSLSYQELHEYAKKVGLELRPMLLDQHEQDVHDSLQLLLEQQPQTMQSLHKSALHFRTPSGKRDETLKKDTITMKRT